MCIRDSIHGGPIKTVHFYKCVTPVYDDVGRRSVYQKVKLFIRSKTDILNVATFKYSLHNFRDYTMPKIPINVSIMFNYCT